MPVTGRNIIKKTAGSILSLSIIWGAIAEAVSPANAQTSLKDFAISLTSGKNVKSISWEKDITSALEQHRTKGEPLKKLQRLLVKNRFYKGYSENSTRPIDGRMGRQTARAIMLFLTKHPDAVPRLSPYYKRHLINKGYKRQLLKLMKKKERKTNLTKEELRNKVELSLINRETLNRTEIRNLQVNLTFLDYKPGKIDGIMGKQTRKAIARFEGKPMPYELDPYEAPPLEGYNGYGVSNKAVLSAWGARVPGSKARVKAPREKELKGQTLIVLDPGHGWKWDKGAKKNGIPETYVIDMAVRALASSLKEQGIPVAFTRYPGHYYRDGASRLASRPRYAKKLKDITGAKRVIFLSIHADYYKKEKAKGSKIFLRYGTPKDHPSSRIAGAIKRVYSIDGKAARQGFDGSNGYRRFKVLRQFWKKNKDLIALLWETGFMSNPKDLTELTNKKFWTKSMEAVAKSISTEIKAMDLGIEPGVVAQTKDKTALNADPNKTSGPTKIAVQKPNTKLRLPALDQGPKSTTGPKPSGAPSPSTKINKPTLK